jgi:hypothetical protein
VGDDVGARVSSGEILKRSDLTGLELGIKLDIVFQNSCVLPDAVDEAERTIFLSLKKRVSNSREIEGIRIGESYQPRFFFACFKRSTFSGVSQ